MDLKKFEYQRAEYVKAFKILEYVQVSARCSLPDYFLLDSGMPNMPFAITVPDKVFNPITEVGKYFVMYDDGKYEIMDRTPFELEFMPRT